MVKVTGPTLSLNAAGSLGKILTYQKRLKGNVVYMKSKPGRIGIVGNTYNQYQVKIYILQAVRHWHLLSASEKQEWDDFID